MDRLGFRDAETSDNSALSRPLMTKTNSMSGHTGNTQMPASGDNDLLVEHRHKGLRFETNGQQRSATTDFDVKQESVARFGQPFNPNPVPFASADRQRTDWSKVRLLRLVQRQEASITKLGRTWSDPNIISSATRPPMHTSSLASICRMLMESSSLSGSCVTIPRAFPRGVMVALWMG
jgi:hypothetical protein